MYGAIAAAPVLGHDAQLNSTRQFMRELNRLGITSAIDAGGGSQRYPEDYDVISELAGSRDMTVRIAYNLFTQKPGQELDDFRAWTKLTAFGDGDARLRVNGVGEMIVYSSYDFENFMQPRPDIPADGRRELSEAIEYLVQHRWPFRLHATYDESIAQYLDVFEAVDRQTPFAGLHWFFDHAETISERSIERVAALGGGIAVQDRMAFAGEHLVSRYGQAAADATPPIKSILAAGIPVGAGTDATRVASYNPWVSLYWMVTGKTVGGHELWSPQTCLDRTQALRLYTQGSAWFSREQEAKGALVPGQYADLAILSADYFSVEVEEIKEIESVLTIMDGEVVYAVGRYAQLAPPALPVVPDWCPVGEYGGAHRPAPAPARTDHTRAGHPPRTAALRPSGSIWGSVPGLACPCFAF